MKSSLFKQFATDKNIESEGIFVRYGEVRFLIARAGGGNHKFQSVFNKKIAPHKRSINAMSDEAALRLQAEVYAESIVLKFQTLESTDSDGTEHWGDYIYDANDNRLDFSPENTVKVLVALPELFADLRAMAADFNNFRKAEDEADAGNSAQS